MLTALRALDERLFHKINQDWTHPWLDAAMPLLTDLHQVRVVIWVVAPLAVGFWLYRERGRAAKTLLGLALAIGLSDMTAHRLIKPYFKRDRPPKTGISVVLRTHQHSGYSFPSNHSANSFAGAAFLGSIYPAARLPALLFAALIAYSRVYVGVHFPADVLAGALFGLAAGLLTARLFLRAGWAQRAQKKRRGR